MAEFNPYAAPEAEVVDTPHGKDDGVWRDGDLLVFSKGAELPDRCLRCNAPAEGYRLKRNLMWHPPGWYVIALFNLILYVLVAMIVRKTAKVRLPVCREHRSRRRRLIGLGWLLSLGGVGVIVGAAVTVESVVGGDDAGVVMAVAFVAGLVMIVAGLIVGFVVSPIANPKRIDKHFVWLSKVGPDFLAGLPPWKPNPPFLEELPGLKYEGE